MTTSRRPESFAGVSAIFREANERIRDAAEEHAMTDAIPFLCECPRPDCTTIVQLSMGEYEAVRAKPSCFLQMPQHQSERGRVVMERDGYVVTDQSDSAGRRAES